MLTIGICSECKSEFYKQSSAMEHLCPECASSLYGYKNCQHDFTNVRCKNVIGTAIQVIILIN